jgi:hypothetical protein
MDFGLGLGVNLIKMTSKEKIILDFIKRAADHDFLKKEYLSSTQLSQIIADEARSVLEKINKMRGKK